MSVHAVLLIPAEGDPHGLLREGPCGARPPVAFHYVVQSDSWWAGCHEHNDIGSINATRTALVLAWAGQPVAEGCWRAYECRTKPHGFLPSFNGWTMGHLDSARYWNLGTVLFLDADGREVTP